MSSSGRAEGHRCRAWAGVRGPGGLRRRAREPMSISGRALSGRADNLSAWADNLSGWDGPQQPELFRYICDVWYAPKSKLNIPKTS